MYHVFIKTFKTSLPIFKIRYEIFIIQEIFIVHQIRPSLLDSSFNVTSIPKMLMRDAAIIHYALFFKKKIMTLHAHYLKED